MKLRLAIIAFLGLASLLIAATIPTAAPVHDPGRGNKWLLAHIADNTQMAATGSGVATVPTDAPVHDPGLGEKALLARIADNTQDIATLGGTVSNDYKVNARAATTANITVTSLSAGATTDDVTLAASDRVLVKSQSTASQNGIFLAGVKQVETATAAGAITGNGNVSVVITSTVVAGSPLTVPVAVLNGDSAATVAGKIRTELAGTAAVTDDFTVSGASTAIVLTALLAPGNDSTLNISLATGTATGLTAAATSANTTAGVAVSRASDSDTWDELSGAFVVVTGGTLNAGGWFNTSAASGTVDVNDLTYTNIAGPASLPLAGGTMTGNISFGSTGTGGLVLNNLTTAQRDGFTPIAGYAVYNTDNHRPEYYDGTALAWRSLDLGQLTGTATVDMNSITDGDAATFPITVTGALTTGTPTVALGWSAVLETGLVVAQAWVSDTDTVTVRINNVSGAPIDPASVTVRATVFQY